MQTEKNNFILKFFLRIILPTIFAIILFITTIFAVILPSFTSALMERKKEMIKELTTTAWSILTEFEKEVNEGRMSLKEAQEKAKYHIQYLRHGSELKDYFWLNDMHPNMIIHPYRPDLNGKDLSTYADPAGKKLFVEFVKVASTQKEGFVEYIWQWKDDDKKLVPKLSYVKLFEPWSWIIGTGIYIEDVKEEISRLTSRLIKISFIIFAIIALILIFILLQSFRIEKSRRAAEFNLRISREKYKTLVEASTEGTIMVLSDGSLFANTTMSDMLGYTESEFNSFSIKDLFDLALSEDISGLKTINTFLQTDSIQMQSEAKFKRKDGTLLEALTVLSKITFAGKTGYTIVVKDIDRLNATEQKLGEIRDKFKELLEISNFGFFRTLYDSRTGGYFLEANNSALKFLGCLNKEELYKKNLLDFFFTEQEKANFLDDLKKDRFIKDRIIHIQSKNEKKIRILSLTVLLVKDERNSRTYCEGLMEDITAKKELEQEQENIIANLQNYMAFLNHPVRIIAKAPVFINFKESILNSALLMNKTRTKHLFVRSDQGENLGIITDNDLRRRAIADKSDLSLPVYNIMSSPIMSVNDHALIYEAIEIIKEKDISSLAVRNEFNEITGIVTEKEILKLQWDSASFLLEGIKKAQSIEELKTKHEKLFSYIQPLIISGTNPRNICKILSDFSVAIIIKLIEITIEEIGEPPAAFAFLVLGSQGREEETLLTDQDNALIIEDVTDEQKPEVVRYFSLFAEKVCNSLDFVGYSFCKGDVMAKNPKWNQPLSVWKNYFYKWITQSQPQDLLEINIFFDLRCIYGKQELAEELKTSITQSLDKNTSFYLHMAMNILSFKSQLGAFGKIAVESSGEYKDKFNIKETIKPIIDLARLYSLKNKLWETHTLERLYKLLQKNVLQEKTFREIEHDYNYLIRLRLKHQSMLIENNQLPDNYISPKKLTHYEEIMLKEIFSHITTFQTRISGDFMGGAKI